MSRLSLSLSLFLSRSRPARGALVLALTALTLVGGSIRALADPTSEPTDFVPAPPAETLRVEWGAPDFTEGNAYIGPGPGWWRGSVKAGGQWTDTGWLAEAVAEPAELLLFLDRTQLAGDLQLRLDLTPLPGVDLRLDLLDETYSPLATDLSDNLALDETPAVRLPLSDYPDAAILRLRRTAGMLLLHACELAPLHPSIQDSDSRGSAKAYREAVEFPGPPVSEARFSDSPVPDQPPPAVPDDPKTPEPPPRGPLSLHVDADHGDDANDGLSPNPAPGGAGPLRTISTAVERAQSGDTLVLSGNAGFRQERWDFGAKRLIIRTRGPVTIRRNEP